MNRKASTAKAKAEQQQEQITEAIAGDPSLETVRDILFGKQLRETKSKEAELEKMIKNSIAELNKKIQAQFKDLNKALAKLEKDTEKAADKTSKKVSREFDATQASIADLQAATKASQSEMYDTLDTARLTLEKEAKSWNESLGNELDEVNATLKHEKTDRATLATLLTNMARELADPDTKK